MANKWFIFKCCCLISISSVVYSDELSSTSKLEENKFNKTEFRAAGFLPVNKNFRNTYGNVGTSLQMEQSRSWINHRYLELWVNLEWVFIDSSNCGPRCFADLNMVNLSLGIKAIGSVYRDFIYLYAGLGPNLGFVLVKNKMWSCNGCSNKETIREYQNKVGVGAVVKSGIQFTCSSHFFVDLFVDYLYLPVHFHSTEDVGGFKAGGALGARY